ncbi:reverse transcriptase domain-containing protein [Tanacetum coccineum]
MKAIIKVQQHCLFACFYLNLTPKKVSEALKIGSWVEAMPGRMFAVQASTKYRVLVDLPKVAKVIARIEAIRLFLAFASFMGFIVYQMDVKSAFLYGTIDEEVYVSQPPGFVVPIILQRAAWIQRGTIDKNFIHEKKNNKDILFQMSSMGELTFFLGLQVKQNKEGIFISQMTQYVVRILKKIAFCECQSCFTPWRPSCLLSKGCGKLFDVDVHLFKIMIGNSKDFSFQSLSRDLQVPQGQTKIGIMGLSLQASMNEREELARYALTANPTIYDSLVKQFWQSAIAREDGSLEISATIDTIRYTISEASIRDSLQLDDATGITMLPNDDLFEDNSTAGENKRTREGDAPMLVKNSTEDKGKILQEEASLHEDANKIGFLTRDREVSKYILDALLHKDCRRRRVIKELLGSETQGETLLRNATKDSLKRFGEGFKQRLKETERRTSMIEAKDDEPTKKSGKRRKNSIAGEKSISRDDLTELYRIVMNKYGLDGPEDNKDYKCGDTIDTSEVQLVLNLESMDVYLLFDRKYPLSPEICQTVLKMKLLDGKMNEDCYRCYALTQQWLSVHHVLTKCGLVAMEQTGSANGNFLTKNTQEALTIIENKSKVQTFRNKSQFSSSSGSSAQDAHITSLTKQVLTESTTSVPPLVVQPSPASTSFELPPAPVTFPIILEPNPHQPQIPYPSRLKKEKLQDKPDIQIYSFLQMIPFNKEKQLIKWKISLNENCSAVLFKTLPKKFGDTGRFLIPCDFNGFESCMALATLGASINLMPLSVWKKLSLPKLSPTRMTLELATQTIKSSIDDPTDLKLKDLPPHLEYAFLEGTSKLPVIIAKDLKREEKEQLLKILMEDYFKPAVQHQRRVNPKIHEVIKAEVININPIFPPKNAGLIYLSLDSPGMPLGLCNAPGTFQRCMMAIFYDMIEKTMEVFMDDFSVFGDSFSSCLYHLDIMLKQCEDTNLVLNWEKCHFMVKEGIVLGHKISKSGIKVDRAKVDMIAKLPPLTTVKGIGSFLGHAGFYSRFIQDFSKTARPMTHLLEKDTPFFF